MSKKAKQENETKNLGRAMTKILKLTYERSYFLGVKINLTTFQDQPNYSLSRVAGAMEALDQKTLKKEKHH